MKIYCSRERYTKFSKYVGADAWIKVYDGTAYQFIRILEEGPKEPKYNSNGELMVQPYSRIEFNRIFCCDLADPYIVDLQEFRDACAVEFDNRAEFYDIVEPKIVISTEELEEAWFEGIVP